MNQENIWCLILHNKVRGQEKKIPTLKESLNDLHGHMAEYSDIGKEHTHSRRSI